MSLSLASSLNLLVAATILCWSIWGIFDKKALNNSASHWDVFLAMILLEIPQAVIWYLVLQQWQPGWHLSWALFTWAGLSACTYAISMVAYLSAMSRTEASFVLGFTAGYPIVSQVLAVLFLGEAFVVSRMAGGVLIALGVLAIGLSSTTSTTSAPNTVHTQSSRWQMYICITVATLCWAVKGLLDKKALAIATPLEVNLAECLTDVLVIVPVLLYLLSRGRKPALSSWSLWKYSSYSALFLALGGLSYLMAMNIASASYVVTITGCYPLLMYLFAVLLLKEPFNRVRLLGIALVVFGGVIVQMTQLM